MATKEDQEALRLLVQHVARAFYEPKYTIILDQLARHPVLKDDDLAGRMGLQPKELNKVIAVLSNDCLVKVYRQNELKEGAQRSVGRQYYYIDYEYFCNVVKWRVAKMRSIIDSSLRNELDNKGYICTQCKQSYSPLDVDKLMDFSTGALTCEICRGEVVDNENAESVLGSKDRMQRFNHQLRFIREGLQKSEAMVLPAFDVASWVKANLTDPDRLKAAATDSSSGGLKIAGSDPSKRSDEDSGIGIVMSMDKDETQQKAERAAQAEAKRQQNALPAWHLKSTITGDLTALGVKENARIEAVKGTTGGGGSNDDILKGLGVVGSRPEQQREQQLRQAALVRVMDDVKPVVNVEIDYYDQYYASLAASSTAASAQPTPPGSSDFNDPVSASASAYGALDEEEDKKPSVEYLDSLNDYRKRSRSREDIGGPPLGKAKFAKIEDSNGMNGNGHLHENGTARMEETRLVADKMMAETASADDPMVYVNGQPKLYSQVTEEDHDLMTPDEYSAFFEAMQAQGG